MHIGMVCDFFYPKVGGVESHIYGLAETLAARGHHVVVITHAYPPRAGVRYMPHIKVYYLPVTPVPPQHIEATLPNLFTHLPYIRSVIVREQLEILHGHAAMSSQALESILHARLMGVKTVFSDHSLFSLASPSELWANKMLTACLSDVSAVICVSHTGRENTVLRGGLDPSQVYVVPNAVDADWFWNTRKSRRAKGNLSDGAATRNGMTTRKKAQKSANTEPIVISCVTRLVQRKGIDLLVEAIPEICRRYRNVRFVVGGEGPMIVELDQMRDRYQHVLGSDFMTLLGRLGPEDVRALLGESDIFLNASLTEAFGIGILEAASAGLVVVSTDVGGVREVLPPHMIEFCTTDVQDMCEAVSRAIAKVHRHDGAQAYSLVREMYSWTRIAARVEAVYENALLQEEPTFAERLVKIARTGPFFGIIMALVLCLDRILLAFLEFVDPRDEIDKCPTYRALQ